MKKSELYEQKIRVTKKATKEDAKLLGCKIGDTFSYIPEPKNKDELFEQFESLYSQKYFESLQELFNEKYGNPTQKIIQDELFEIEIFITKSNSISTLATCENKIVEPELSDLHEYSRLVNDYYKNDNKPFHPYSFFNNNSSWVYAKYFLYKNWLEQMFDKCLNTDLTNSNSPINKNTEIVKYTVNEYALAYIFDLWAIGKQLPINKTEGGYSKKQIENDCTKFKSYDKKPDSFYRAVKKLRTTYDLINPNDLKHISNNWLNAVKQLSNNWKETKLFLESKQLFRE